MFYNVIGLAFVSCFICAVVNAIDDFNAMRDAVNWAARSFKPSTLRSRSGKRRKGCDAELEERGTRGSKLESNGNYFDRSNLEAASTSDVKLSHENKGQYNSGIDDKEW